MADNRRILICDDMASIHDDFRKILSPASKERHSLASMLATLRQEESGTIPAEAQIVYELSHAQQGKQALELATEGLEADRPFAMTFMDVRMPPGWDGIETIKRIWEVDPNVEMVICTAFSDYSWEDILKQFGSTDKLQFIRKPADFVTVKQLALSLTTKWNLGLRSRQYLEDLETEVKARTRQLSEKIEELHRAMEEITQLRGILPMCAYCHKIRSDANYWQAVDEYIKVHTSAEISHGVCPDCYRKIMGKALT